MAKSLIQELKSAVGKDHVRSGQAERLAYSADMWPRHQIWKQGGDPARYPPQAVVWPADEAQVQQVTRIAKKHGCPLIPYGAGSGVCGGTVPIHGGIVMDLKRLNRVLSVDDRDLTVTAETGIIGMHLEEELNDRGYTLGHFPSSILCSTLGGWLAARSAGQFSSRYGKIEDMVVGMRVVTSVGDVLKTGPEQPFDWTQLLVGSEGTLASLTEATLRIHDRPVASAFRGYRFRTVESGLRAIRQVMQAGLLPHVVRLYDPFDSLLHSTGTTSEGGVSSMLRPLRTFFGGLKAKKKGGPSGRAIAMALSYPSVLNKIIDSLPVSSLLIFGFDGSQQEVNSDMERARKIMVAAGGVDGGEGPGRHWEANRYNVSFKQSPIFDAGAFADTMEVSCMWSNLHQVYRAVRAAVSPHALIMAHFSHSYPEGCSIYFTFAGYKGSAVALERLYDKVWSEALGAALSAGAWASHHHGVGYAKRDFMRREHGAGIRLLYALKDSFDPTDMMNPGKVLPDRAVQE